MQRFDTLTFIQHTFFAALLTGVLTPSGCAGHRPPRNSSENAVSASDGGAEGPHPAGTDLAAGSPPKTMVPGSYPKIEIDAENGRKKRIRHSFPFEGETVRVELEVSRAVLEGARNAYKYAVSIAGQEDPDWRDRYNRAFIDDPAQAPFLDELHSELLDIARQKKLDGDRTVELMTAFVQYIEYDTTRAAKPKFPIETFADKKGDCDDKSRLLVALLARSDYRVATLHFDEENHMAVGIKSDGDDYRNTGYTYIETTSPSLIGFPFSEKADVQLHTVPTVHRVGTGKRKYTATKDIKFLVDTLTSLEKKITKGQKTLDELNQACADAEKKVAALQRQLNNSASSVNAYNSAVDKFNSLIKKQRSLAGNTNELIDLRNFIVQNSTSRYSTVKHVRKVLKTLK
ncbi:MAG: hypothetical protein JXX14_17225 [Deltaproteobacteria bacterium]|nr:hypothetical protein [Deltaproteobacteria bacterium]